MLNTFRVACSYMRGIWNTLGYTRNMFFVYHHCNVSFEKAVLVTCPYYNGRMCDPACHSQAHRLVRALFTQTSNPRSSDALPHT